MVKMTWFIRIYEQPILIFKLMCQSGYRRVQTEIRSLSSRSPLSSLQFKARQCSRRPNGLWTKWSPSVSRTRMLSEMARSSTAWVFRDDPASTFVKTWTSPVRAFTSTATSRHWHLRPQRRRSRTRQSLDEERHPDSPSWLQDNCSQVCERLAPVTGGFRR